MEETVHDDAVRSFTVCAMEASSVILIWPAHQEVLSNYHANLDYENYFQILTQHLGSFA
jgi:hypothetical protein